MKVLKFGGTSLGSVKNLCKIKNILTKDNDEKIIVCSAMSGVTNQLVDLAEKIKNNNKNSILRCLRKIQNSHNEIIENLIDNQYIVNRIKYDLSFMIIDLFDLCEVKYSDEIRSKIITSGEMFLTYIFSNFLKYVGVSNVLLDAKDFMYVDDIENPNIDKVRKKLNKVRENNPISKLYITQGFVCKNKENKISHLKRGGSDYSATIIGAALNAEEIQIWTDIDGLQNNDPRYVSETYPISHITYNEASSLAFFGAKILHPQTVSPVVEKEIPILLKNTFAPKALGTVISNRTYQKGLKGISAKDNIKMLKIKSNRSLIHYEYFKKVFDILYNYNISADMITASEVSISLAVEDTNCLNEIISELGEFSEISQCMNCSIICVVGESLIKDENSHKVFDILEHTYLKMISYGNNDNNITILINTEDKANILNYLNQELFQIEYETV
ncbi:aspartate kinase [uncultured Aquimarina sp.]|uniref:aspartate kinase n=1 Tax=uncultured Aquimarina sp. TaxID=575652 RepID=UPI00262E1B6B|nr:aspartate kinase [uncultured Aquimarina sp.]